MNAEAMLLSKIFSITRGDLDSAVFPMPQPTRMLAGSQLVRLTRLARFWQNSGFCPDALTQSTVDLLAGFHAQTSPFIFIVRGEARNAEYWLGGPKTLFCKDLVSRMMRSAFPDCRTGETNDFPPDHFATMSHAALLTGTPTLRETGDQRIVSDQIERVIRGLQGRRWAFIVSAHPLAPAVVVRTINEIGTEIRDCRATFLLKQSPIDEYNRTAQRYIDLLEAKLKRFESGRMQGMWLSHIALFAEDSATLALGQGLLHSAYSGERSVPDPIRCSSCSATANEAPALEPITTTELAAFARPPQEEYAGYEVVDYTRYGVHGTVILPVGQPVSIGEIIDRGMPTGNYLRVPQEDFVKHGLIVGITGSGKTNSCIALLRQLWASGRGVPFLVVESAKSEYRDLMMDSEFESLKVFTVADETASPLRLNPLEVPDGVLVQTHIDYVKSLFSAAFVLYPPMPYVLEQSIQEIYEDRGWDLALNVNPRGKSRRAFPTLSDLAEKIVSVIQRMGYDERITMDVRAGLLARVNQLRIGGGKGLMFDVRQSTPDRLLFESPCVVELKSLVSDDEKAFLIGLLLIRLYEHAEADQRRRDGKLHHVTLVEEAHRLLRNTSSEQAGDFANPRGRAIEVFANILSEIRGYGEGVLIAEQVPSKLTPDCIKNTSLKVVHRLLVEDDRDLLGKAINLDEQQTCGLGLLTTGEAVVFAEKLQKPVLAKMPLAREPQSPIQAQHLASKMKDIGRLSSGACRYCHRAGSLCRPFQGMSAPDFTMAFQRFFNSLRFNSPSVQAQYDILAQLHAAAIGTQVAPFNCVLARLADDECDRRGRFFGWNFADVDRAVEALLDEVDFLAAGQAIRGGFARLMQELHFRRNGPFAGCKCCASRCQHRFDATQRSVAYGMEFQAQFKKAPVSWNSLVAICWPASQSVPDDARRAHQETALCFAIQQLHQLQITPAKQQQTAAQLVKYLSLEAENGREAIGARAGN